MSMTIRISSPATYNDHNNVKHTAPWLTRVDIEKQVLKVFSEEDVKENGAVNGANESDGNANKTIQKTSYVFMTAQATDTNKVPIGLGDMSWLCSCLADQKYKEETVIKKELNLLYDRCIFVTLGNYQYDKFILYSKEFFQIGSLEVKKKDLPKDNYRIQDDADKKECAATNFQAAFNKMIELKDNQAEALKHFSTCLEIMENARDQSFELNTDG